MKKRFLTLLLSATLLLSLPLTVCAAPKTMSDGQTFDAEFYAKTYPDVVDALGNSESALYSHYVNYGKAEGRLPYANAPKPQSTNTTGIPKGVTINYWTDCKDLGDGTYLQLPLQFEVISENGATYQVTDKDVIEMAKDVAPNGTEWGFETYYDLLGYKKGNNVPKRASSCQAFAYWLTDAIYGNTPAYLINSADENGNIVIKQYDIILYGDHCIVALNVDTEKMTVTAAEGGYNGAVKWGRTVKIDDMISAGNFGIIRRKGY